MAAGWCCTNRAHISGVLSCWSLIKMLWARQHAKRKLVSLVPTCLRSWCLALQHGLPMTAPVPQGGGLRNLARVWHPAVNRSAAHQLMSSACQGYPAGHGSGLRQGAGQSSIQRGTPALVRREDVLGQRLGHALVTSNTPLVLVLRQEPLCLESGRHRDLISKKAVKSRQ